MCSSSSERWEAAYTRLLMPSRSFPFYCSSGRNVVWGSPSAFLCPIDQGLKYQFRASPYIDAAICFRSDDLFRDLLRKLPLHGLRRRYIHGGTNNGKTNIREKHYCCLKYFMMMKPYFQQCIKQTKKKWFLRQSECVYMFTTVSLPSASSSWSSTDKICQIIEQWTSTLQPYIIVMGWRTTPWSNGGNVVR